MIFTRKIDDGLAGLVKKLDKVVADNEEKKMAAFVNFLGDDPDALAKAAVEFGQKNELANTVLAVPVDNADGPGRYGIASETSLAVFLYRGKKVQARHLFADGALKEADVATIVADTDKILSEEADTE